MNRQQFLQQIVCSILAALLLTGCSGAQVDPTTRMSPPTSTPILASNTKQALFVIFDQFEENEYGIPRAILEDKGVIVTVASSSLDVVKGHQGKEVRPDTSLSNMHAADYDAIVFVGGYNYDRNNPETYRIAQETVAEGKVLAAICVAPITLAKAGVLKGKRATTSLPSSTLEAEGAIYTGAAVERDGLIITANGPQASRQFGETIAAALGE